MKQKLRNGRLLDRLKAYGLAAGALAAGAEGADAAIIYTDINPNYTGGIGNQYLLDLNNDNTDDFRIYHDGGSNLFIEPLASANEVLGTGSLGGFAYPYAMNSNSMISASASGTWFNNAYSTGYQSLNYGSASFGNWVSVSDKYLGLRFQVSGNTHYGWARLDVNFSGSTWVVKDYAYEDNAGVGIPAGSSVSPMAASGASNVMGSDIDDNSNGTDLEVSFDAGTNENTINEYRIMVVKNNNVGSFNLPAAQAVAMANYTAVTPNGNATYTQAMASAANDVNGDPIQNGQPYRIFVMSEADGNNANADSLSLPSDTVTLYIPSTPATNVSASDVGNIGNSTDLEVNFDAGANEATIDEYRVMVVKQANAASFNLDSAQNVAFFNFHAVNPAGLSSYSENIPINVSDVDGDPIEMGQPYQVFVLATADGMNAGNDTLSSASNTVTLTLPSSPATNVAAADIDDNNNGTDLEVTFDAAAEESRVGEYRVMVVKSASATTFNLTNAQAVASGNYSSLAPDGSASYSTVLDAGANDTDGDAIAINTDYNVFVLSVADGVSATTDTLSSASDSIMLNIEVNASPNVIAFDAANELDGSDLHVTFDAADEEGQISEYRVMVANSGSNLDLEDAQAVGSGNYTMVNANGSAEYAIGLAANASDINGNAISQNQSYEVYVMSVANGTDANIDNISEPSNAVNLTDVLGIENAEGELAKVYSRNKSVIISNLSEGNHNIRIIGLQGNLVEQRQVNGGLIEIDLSHMASGVYLVEIDNDSETQRSRVFLD